MRWIARERPKIDRVAISLGLSDMHPGDDQAVLRDGFIVYDALYQWLKFCRGEKHLWFPPAVKPSTAV
jgi:hypothetical protein